jgi:mono/diheme cytochrome c family protein
MKQFVVLGVVLALGMPLAYAAGDAAAGKTAYNTRCKVCHGPEGKGGTPVMKTQGGEKTDLTSKEVQAKSDAELKKLAVGGYNKKKPLKLTDQQLDDVVAFVRTLK